MTTELYKPLNFQNFYIEDYYDHPLAGLCYIQGSWYYFRLYDDWTKNNLFIYEVWDIPPQMKLNKIAMKRLFNRHVKNAWNRDTFGNVQQSKPSYGSNFYFRLKKPYLNRKFEQLLKRYGKFVGFCLLLESKYGARLRSINFKKKYKKQKHRSYYLRHKIFKDGYVPMKWINSLKPLPTKPFSETDSSLILDSLVIDYEKAWEEFIDDYDQLLEKAIEKVQERHPLTYDLHVQKLKRKIP